MNFGTFKILRLDDPTRKYICVVSCDICKTGSAFDERKVKNPRVKAEEIAAAHVCRHRDLTAEEKRKILAPKKAAPYTPALHEAKAGTLRRRAYGETTGGEDGKENSRSGKR